MGHKSRPNKNYVGIEMQNLIFVSEILFGMRLPCIVPQKRGEWAWFPFWSYSQDLRLGQALTKAITNVLNTYPPQDSVGSDTQTGVALVQYPYWPLTRVAYLRTEGRPPHRSEISLGIFPFSNISMFMINQIKWSMFWSVIFVRYKIWRPYAIGERWQPKECSVMQTFCVLGGSSHLFTARKFVPPVQILGANSWCSTILMKLFWRKPENVSGERRLVCAIKRVPQCTQPTNKKTFYIILLLHSFPFNLQLGAFFHAL